MIETEQNVGQAVNDEKRQPLSEDEDEDENEDEEHEEDEYLGGEVNFKTVLHDNDPTSDKNAPEL